MALLDELFGGMQNFGEALQGPGVFAPGAAGSAQPPTPPLGATAPASSNAGSDRIKVGTEIYNFFLSKGMSPQQAAAVAGNMAWEGGGRVDLVNPNDNSRNSPRSPHSIGIGQWNDRAPALIDFARRSGVELPEGDTRSVAYMRDVAKRLPLKTQMEFAYAEMQGPERKAYERILAGKDVTSAAAGAIGYHRPSGWTSSNPYAGHGFNNRVAIANQILKSASSNPQLPDGMDARTVAPATSPVSPGLPVQVAQVQPQSITPASIPQGPPMADLTKNGGGGIMGMLGSLGGGEDTQKIMEKLAAQSRQRQEQANQAAAQSQVLKMPLKQADITSIINLLQKRRPLGLGEA